MSLHRIAELCDTINAAMDELREIKASDSYLRFDIADKSVGSILNGYREGDLDWEATIKLLMSSNLVFSALSDEFSKHNSRIKPNMSSRKYELAVGSCMAIIELKEKLEKLHGIKNVRIPGARGGQQ